MAEGGLSIGVLSGRIDLDDNFTATITLSNTALDELEKRFGGVHTSAVHVAAGMFTAEAAIEAVKEVAHLAAEALKEISIEGSKVADVEHNFNRLSLSAGQLGETLLGTLKTGTHGTITDFELMKSVNDNLAAGVKLTGAQYNDLATGAFNLAQAKGMEVKDAFDKINDALLTGRVRGVQYLTGKIDMANAEDVYAKKLGTTSERLTADEKLEAARAAILDRVRASTERLGAQQDGLDEKVAQVAVTWANFQEDLGKTVATSPVVLQAFDDISNILSEAFGGDKEAAIENIVHAIEKVATVGVDVVKVGVEIVEFFVEWKDVLEPLVITLGAYYTAVYTVEVATKAWGVASATTGGAIAALMTPLGLVAIAAGAMYAAFELGHWQPISDFFEKLGLEVFYGMTGAEADAAVATHHLSDAAIAATAAEKAHAAAAEEIALATMKWHEVLLTINPAILEEAEHLLASGVSAKTVAEEFSLTAVQTKALQQDLAETARVAEQNEKAMAGLAGQLRLSKKEMEEFSKLWEGLSSIGTNYSQTIATINPKIRDSVTYYAALGVSVGDLVKAFPGLNQVQAEAAVLSAKSALEIQKGWTDVFALTTKMHGDNINGYIALETKRYDLHIKQLEQEGKLTGERLAEEQAMYAATINSEIQKREQQINTSRAFFQQEADTAKAKLNLMMLHTEDFIARDIQLAQQDFNEKERILNHWAAAANEKLDAATDKTKTETTKQGEAIDGLALHWNVVGHAVDKNIEKVRTLSGEVITLKEYEARQAAGGSFAVTSQNFQKTLGDLITSGGWNPTGQGSNIDVNMAYRWAQQGYSFQEIITMFQNLKSGASGPLPPPQGPRIPGFREGGVGDFGAGTMAMLHGKEAIVPLDSGSGGIGGVTMHNTFQIVDTESNIASRLSDRLLELIMAGEKIRSS